MRRLRGFRCALAFVVAGAALAACSHSVPSQVGREETRWEAKHVVNYDFVYSRNSMVGPCALLVHVRDARVVSASVQKQCGAPLDPAKAPTIEAVFATTRSVYGHDDRVDVTYNPTYGFPASVNVDPNTNATDDEWGIAVSSFRPR